MKEVIGTVAIVAVGVVFTAAVFYGLFSLERHAYCRDIQDAIWNDNFDKERYTLDGLKLMYERDCGMTNPNLPR